MVIVDPDTATVCPPDTLGEIWVDSPSITGGFWGLSQHTESIFHAKPLIVSVETHYPETYNEPFLRTGLCGTIIGGRLFVLGTYEERVRQQRLGSDFGIQDTYFSNEILYTLSKRTHIDQWYSLKVNGRKIESCNSNVLFCLLF